MISLFVAPSALGQDGPQCPRDTDGTCINGNFPNPMDCGSFYQCSNCIRYLQQCPPGLHYSPRYDACVTVQEAKCTGISYDYIHYNLL